MSVNIAIADGYFQATVKVKRGEYLRFTSPDKGRKYVIDCAEDGLCISHQFPFTVEGDGEAHILKIRRDAEKGDYKCVIIPGENTPLYNPEPPTMIIEVG